MKTRSEDPSEQVVCKAEYQALEDCLADNDRKWTKCQAPLKTWKDCFQAANNDGGDAQPKSTQ